MKKSRFLKPGRLMIYLFILLWFFSYIFGSGTYEIVTTYRMVDGARVAGLYPEIDMGFLGKIKLKRFMKQHEEDIKTIQQGSYVFSGSYTPQEILDIFLAGPSQVYEQPTLLEGRSSYDVDAYLAKKGLIEAGAYLAFIADQELISRYIQRYDFLSVAFEERGSLPSLEGYLYPDTYFVDPDKDVVDQLVYLQLEGFKKKIWEPYGSSLKDLSSSLKMKGYTFNLSTYGALILASIIDKEERYGPNRPLIASVFYNRLETGMRIDADISLCYGLKTGYDSCTPSVIVEHLQDTGNLYNTRALAGLPPTPIVSPTISSITALLEAQKSDNFFYLHDPEGNLHTAKNNAEHTVNKNKYLY